MKYLLLLLPYLLFSQETYTVECTTYYVDSCYTTGYNVVKRNLTNKKKFLKSKGYKKTPEGYEVDHITPLSQGGTDCPDNMQLLTIEEHRRKTAKERIIRNNIYHCKKSEQE